MIAGTCSGALAAGVALAGCAPARDRWLRTWEPAGSLDWVLARWVRGWTVVVLDAAGAGAGEDCLPMMNPAARAKTVAAMRVG
jgi:hypothetical protein